MRTLLILLFFTFPLSLFAQSSNIDVLHYKYELILTDASDTIRGKATINFKTVAPAQTVAFHLTNAKGGKGMRVASVSVSNTPVKFQHVDDKINITMPLQQNAVTENEVQIQYAGIPADGLIISKNMHGDRTFFADNWPNRAQHWIPCNDIPGDKASVEFIVTAPAHYSIISNGTKVFEKMIGSNKQTHWKEITSIPTKVMVIGAARFAVKNYSDSAVVPVSAWVYTQDSAKGFYDYALAPEILQFFATYIGPYPYAKLANVQSKTIFGGMENASAIFYAENSVTGTRSAEGLIAHEIAHQWFGNTATEKSFAHVWLSEGFASYMTHVYLEQKYGLDTLLKGLRADRQQVVQFSKRWNKPVVDSTSELMDLLNANSYQKGAWILHMLRHKVGDAPFQKIIQTYYNQYKGSNAATADFQKIAVNVSGKNLDTFFKQWLYQHQLPKLQVQWKKSGDQLLVTVRQLQTQLFVFPLQLGIISNSGAMPVEKLEISQKETTFTLKGNASVKNVVLDPFVQLLFEGDVMQVK